MDAKSNRRWLSPCLRRWRMLMDAVQVIDSGITQDVVEKWISSGWLVRATSPQVAERARLALSNNMTHKELAETFGTTPSQYGLAIHTTCFALQEVFRGVKSGELCTEVPGIVYPALHATFHWSLVTGVAKSSYFKGDPSLLNVKFCQLEDTCSESGGMTDSELAMTLSAYTIGKICRVCAEVHRQNGHPCSKCSNRARAARQIKEMVG